MLPSVRRVVSAPSTPLVSSLSSSAPRTAAQATVGIARPIRHQRRFSSSKPSSSDNGSRDISGQQQSAVPASTSSRSGEAKSNGEKRKRKSKDASERQAAAARKLPSVPSTQHLSQEALGLSTFFSMHRPISVTHSIPKTITEEAFASIFNHARSKGRNVNDVISTLSRTTEDLEGAMAQMTVSNQPEPDANGDPVRKIDVRHPDGTESSVYVQLNSMAGEFAPFQPPPAPEVQGVATHGSESQQLESAAEEQHQLADEGQQQQQHRVYRALFTIEESTDEAGQVRVMAHSPQIVHNEGTPRSFLERMARRQTLFDEAQSGSRDRTMQAISVKRQRKLKMKKKKYKKLMKRTRNERRKLDRL